MPLDDVSAISNLGSLLSLDGKIVAPYDLEFSNGPMTGYRALGLSNGIFNAALAAFRLDYAFISQVIVINGMGVTLGDSIVGITALLAIKANFPNISFKIFRPRHTAKFVKQLYELASPLLGTIVDLPVKLYPLAQGELRIDIGNHLFWPKFAELPMIDFFIDAMGITPQSISAERKRNQWLKGISLPTPQVINGEYVLLCPTASTPVRSIPVSQRARLAEALWQHFRLPVAGFGAIDHAHYTDLTPRSPDTAHFIAWIKGARYVVTPDTAALHIAAGFDIPTTAFFTTIAPDLRVRDYPHCHSIDLSLPQLAGIHASNRTKDIELIERAYNALSADRFFR
ncbi:ADP-heptose--LPS heptosyltransferase [Caballeronia sp. DA-9]|uniref:ADP-heptose--LPS heptosyltransferase n=1 Tax=Caballeronia sp. DA-9 TaxID=3436237 RepID=UPI003F66566D